MAVPPRPGTDWTDDEHAEIRRLEKACHSSEAWSLECGHTDVGDPWCIVYDRHHQVIVVHIARIDRQYVVVWPREQHCKKTAIMAVAIDIALEGLQAYQRRAS